MSIVTLRLSADDARRLTERIRLTAHTFAESRSKLIELVEEAKSGNAHEALGYASWTAYLSDVLGDEPLRLARDDRKELEGILAAEGMSTRAIAPIVGASFKTVARDLTPVSHDTPADETSYLTARPANSERLGRSVIGLDGKTYAPRPDVIRVDRETGEVVDATPRTPPRRPITDQFFDAAFDLTKVTERIERLAADDRFPQNAEKVAAKHRADLLRARDLLDQVISRLARV